MIVTKKVQTEITKDFVSKIPDMSWPICKKNMNILPSGVSSTSFSFQNIGDNVIYIMQKRAKIYIQNGTSNITQWEEWC